MTRNPTVIFIAAALALCLVSTEAFPTATPQGYRKSTTALLVSGKGDLEKKIAATVLATSYLVFAANHALAVPTPSSLEGSSQLVAPVEVVSPFGGGFGGFGFSPFGVSPIGGFGFGFGIRATPSPRPDTDIQRSKAELEAIKEREAQLEQNIQTLEKQEKQTAPKSK